MYAFPFRRRQRGRRRVVGLQNDDHGLSSPSSCVRSARTHALLPCRDRTDLHPDNVVFCFDTARMTDSASCRISHWVCHGEKGKDTCSYRGSKDARARAQTYGRSYNKPSRLDGGDGDAVVSVLPHHSNRSILSSGGKGDTARGSELSVVPEKYISPASQCTITRMEYACVCVCARAQDRCCHYSMA